MKKIRRSALSAGLAGVLFACIYLAGCKTGEEAEEALPQPQQTARPHIPARKMLVPRTLVFARSQTKYGFFQNYLHRWIDRPLLCDRSMRPKPWVVMTYPSHLLNIQLMKSYGLDALSVFGDTPAKWDRYRLTAEFTDRAKLPDFGFVTVFSPSYHKLDVDFSTKVIARALQSKSALRIGGKILIETYGTKQATPEEWKKFRHELQTRFGDTFLFICHAYPTKDSVYKLMHEYCQNGGKLPGPTLEKAKAHVRSLLDVFDGVLFGDSQLRTYEAKFFAKFYEDMIVSVFQSVLSEPRYAGKAFGLASVVGYINPGSGSTCHEEGTKTLRRSFEIAMKARPDYIVLIEWDEANENNGSQPTVYRSFSSRRIIAHYMHRLKNEPTAPTPGDDLSIPNLIVSYRRYLKLGEPLEIELLNVPDSEKNERYTVELCLKDIGGKVIKRFPAVSFFVKELRDKTFVVPSENFAAHLVLAPSLVVTNPAGKRTTFDKGLLHIRLQATWNWNRQWVKMPLRDLCAPVSAAFQVVEKKNGEKNRVEISGSVECGEEIASVEVLEDGDEIYAVDREKEYGDKDDTIVLRISYKSIRRKSDFSGKLTVRNAAFKFRPLLHSYSVLLKWRRQDNTILINQNANSERSAMFLAIPRQDQEAGVLEFDFNYFKTTIPVKRIVAKGIYSETYEDGLTLIVEKFDKLPDHPVHVNAKKTAFRFTASPESANSIYHMRVITKSGKIYRSLPLPTGEQRKGEKTKLNIYSYTEKKVVAVEIDKSRIPNVAYDFTSEYGTTFHTSAGYSWLGEIGCGTDYGQPFRSASRLPKDAKITAPKWVTEDGATCLKFDGKGNFITFPRELLPRGPFTLSFEIKPTSDKPQLLFISYGHYPGSLTVWLKDGKLKGRYLGKLTKKNFANHLWFKEITLETGLAVPIGKWSKVEVSYDLKNFVFKVDGKASAPIPFSQEGFAFSNSVFGGYRRTPMGKLEDFSGFEGYLRSFRVRHNAVGPGLK